MPNPPVEEVTSETREHEQPMADPSVKHELQPLVSCECDANFGEGWYQYRVYEADVVEEHIARLQPNILATKRIVTERDAALAEVLVKEQKYQNYRIEAQKEYERYEAEILVLREQIAHENFMSSVLKTEPNPQPLQLCDDVHIVHPKDSGRCVACVERERRVIAEAELSRVRKELENAKQQG